MRRIAFVGGTRFIGHAAASLARDRGAEVHILHRGVHPCEVEGVEAWQVDRNDSHALKERLHALKPEVVVDTRSMCAADASKMAFAWPETSRLVVLSSQDSYAQFAHLNGHPLLFAEPLIDEDSTRAPLYPRRGLIGEPLPDEEEYSKVRVEEILSDAAGERSLTVLRLPIVYGPRDPQRRFSAIVDRLDQNEAIPHRGGAGFVATRAHVQDVAHGIWLAAARIGMPRAYNLGEGHPVSMKVWAERIASKMGVPLRWEEVAELPPDAGLLGELPCDVCADTRRVRNELRYEEITDLEKRVADIIASARESRP